MRFPAVRSSHTQINWYLQMAKPRILSTSVIAESRLFRIQAIDLAFSNGVEATFESVRMGGDGVVMVAAIDEGDELVMIREYAACQDRYEIGFVKGKIDPGESPEVSAGRELKEEIGFGAKDLKKMRMISYSPAYTDLETHLYVARDLYPESAEGDEIEPLEQFRFPLSEIDHLLDHPEITDVRVLMMLLQLQKQSE